MPVLWILGFNVVPGVIFVNLWNGMELLQIPHHYESKTSSCDVETNTSSLYWVQKNIFGETSGNFTQTSLLGFWIVGTIKEVEGYWKYFHFNSNCKISKSSCDNFLKEISKYWNFLKVLKSFPGKKITIFDDSFTGGEPYLRIPQIQIIFWLWQHSLKL